jgi:hypothetical protein
MRIMLTATKSAERTSATVPFSIRGKSQRPSPYSGASPIRIIEIGIQTMAKRDQIWNTFSDMKYVMIEKRKSGKIGSSASPRPSKNAPHEL